MNCAKEPLNKWLRRRSAALRGARTLAYLLDMSRVLRSVRLASHPARSLFQRFPKSLALLVVLLLAGCAAAPPAEKPAETQATHVSVPPPDPVLEAVRADYEIALTLLHSGELQDAVTMLREIVERAPQAVAPLANLALAQQRLGQLDEAAQSLAAAIVRHPEATLHNQLGVVQRQQGHFIEARRSYEAALALDSEFAPAHYNLAILCDLYLDDAPAALEHYRHYQRLTAQEEKSQVAGWIAELERRTRGAP